MMPDAECVRIVAEILSQLELGSFVIKVSASDSHRPYSTYYVYYVSVYVHVYVHVCVLYTCVCVGEPSQGAGWDVCSLWSAT